MLEGWEDVAGVRRNGGVVVVERLGGDSGDCCCWRVATRQLSHCRPHLLSVRPTIDFAQMSAAASHHVFSNALKASTPAFPTRPACINLF